MWNPSLVAGPFQWPDRVGYHLNVASGHVPEAAAVAIVEPTSPDRVFAGDRGIAFTVPIVDELGNKIGSTPNPVWVRDGARAFDTVFLLFVDEAEARRLMPELWIADVGAGSTAPKPAKGAQ